jgi:hypothetical protein
MVESMQSRGSVAVLKLIRTVVLATVLAHESAPRRNPIVDARDPDCPGNAPRRDAGRHAFSARETFCGFENQVTKAVKYFTSDGGQSHVRDGHQACTRESLSKRLDPPTANLVGQALDR